MHRHLVRLAARPAPQRPAKVIQLEARRFGAAPHTDVAEQEYAPVSEAGGLRP